MPIAKANGAELYYEETGSGSPIILTGGGLNGGFEVYEPIIGGLAQEHRVIAYDRRWGRQSKSPLAVQTWDLSCNDLIGLMDALGIEQAYLGGGSFAPGISMGCAARYPDRVLALFPSLVAGGIVCDAFLATKLYRSMDIAMNQGMKAVVAAHDRLDLWAAFVPDQVEYDPEYRNTIVCMAPEEFAQIMRDTIFALLDGPYVSLGMTEEMLKGLRTPTLIFPGHDDIHPRYIGERIHRLIPNSQWSEIPSNTYDAENHEQPELYIERVLQFLSEVEAGHN